VVWVNKYKNANVFVTSIGHHNSTMEDAEYHSLIANGISWVVNESKATS